MSPMGLPFLKAATPQRRRRISRGGSQAESETREAALTHGDGPRICQGIVEKKADDLPLVVHRIVRRVVVYSHEIQRTLDGGSFLGAELGQPVAHPCPH